MPQNTNPPDQFYGKDLAYVRDVGYGEIAQAAAVFLLQQLAKSNLNSGLIIDLGCGSGIFAKEISRSPNNYDFLGIDYSQDFLDIARQKAPKAQFIRGSFLDFPIPKCLAVTGASHISKNTFFLLRVPSFPVPSFPVPSFPVPRSPFPVP